MSDNLRELLQLRQHFLQQLSGYDWYTTHHCLRTAKLAVHLGKACGLSGFELGCLSIAASLHDIGKVHVPKPILNKVSALDAEEWGVMQRHAEIGHQVIEEHAQTSPSCLVLTHIAQGIRHHHEAFDGTGYPDGLEGTDIPLLSRMIALADSFDAMTSQRPYRDPLTPHAALTVICEVQGYRYDPDLQNRFCHLMTGEQSQSMA